MKPEQSAFPVRTEVFDSNDRKVGDFTAPGLSKREWFAGLALQGLLANSSEPFRQIEDAVYYADALIKELEKEEG